MVLGWVEAAASARRPATLWVEARRFRGETLNPKPYAFFGRSAVIRTFALAFSNFTQPTRTRRFPIKLFIKKRIFWSICGHPDFCSFGQPTRTRRFPINLFIKKRIFWSICGHPDFCNHFFAILGSQNKLVDFFLNCLLRNAFFVDLRSSGLL